MRRLLPDAEQMAVPKVPAPYERRHLVLGSFGSSAMSSPQKQADLMRFMTATTAMSDTALLVTHKGAVGAFDSPGFELAVCHHGAIVGRDGHRNVRSLFVTGARSLPARAAAELAAALTGEAVPIASRVPVQSRVQLRNSTSMIVTRSAYDDERTLSAHDAVYRADQAQACRGRGILRTAENPLETFIFATSAPPDMIFDTVARWAEVRPDCIDQMLQAGTVCTSPTHAAIVHPKMFGSAKAAEHRFARAIARTRHRFNLPVSMTTAAVVGWRVERQAATWEQNWTSDSYQRFGHGPARPPAASRGGGADRGRQLPSAPACRPRSGAHPLQGAHPSAINLGTAEAPGPPAQGRGPRHEHRLSHPGVPAAPLNGVT